MATTYDYVDKSTGAPYEGNATGVITFGPVGNFTWKRTINLATAASDMGVTTAFGANDVLQVFNVKEGQRIKFVAIECRTAEGATLSCEFGDGDDTDGYVTAFDLVATGWFSSGDGTYEGDYVDGTTYFGGRLYTAADTLDLKLVTASANVAVIDIYVEGTDYNPVG